MKRSSIIVIILLASLMGMGQFTLSHAFFGLSGGGEKFYQEPTEGPQLHIVNKMEEKKILHTSRDNICQMSINDLKVFKSISKSNIPFGERHSLRISPGTYKITIYVGSPVPFKSDCFSRWREAEIEVRTNDIIILMKPGPASLRNAVLGSLGGATDMHISEIERQETAPAFKPQSEPPVPANEATVGQSDRPKAAAGVTERLESLKRLYDKGQISEDEYRKLRRRVLDKIVDEGLAEESESEDTAVKKKNVRKRSPRRQK